MWLEATVGAIGGVILAWIAVRLYFKQQIKNLKKNYDPNDDLGRKGEGFKDRTTRETGISPIRPDKPKRRELLPPTTIDSPSNNNTGDRKPNNLSKIFRKFRTKK